MLCIFSIAFLQTLAGSFAKLEMEVNLFISTTGEQPVKSREQFSNVIQGVEFKFPTLSMASWKKWDRLLEHTTAQSL